MMIAQKSIGYLTVSEDRTCCGLLQEKQSVWLGELSVFPACQWEDSQGKDADVGRQAGWVVRRVL